MKIKLTVGIAGPEFDAKPGDVIDLPEAEALRYIASEAAVSAEPPKPPKAK